MPTGSIYSVTMPTGSIYSVTMPTGSIYSVFMPTGSIYSVTMPTGSIYSVTMPTGSIYSVTMPTGTCYTDGSHLHSYSQHELLLNCPFSASASFGFVELTSPLLVPLPLSLYLSFKWLRAERSLRLAVSNEWMRLSWATITCCFWSTTLWSWTCSRWRFSSTLINLNKNNNKTSATTAHCSIISIW